MFLSMGMDTQHYCSRGKGSGHAYEDLVHGVQYIKTCAKVRGTSCHFTLVSFFFYFYLFLLHYSLVL